MQQDTEKYSRAFEGMSAEKIEDLNRLNEEEHQRQVEAFIAGYKQDTCYLCKQPFKTMSRNNPCLHWLLRQCKFKKKTSQKFIKNMAMEVLLHLLDGVQIKNVFFQILMT